jgi:hypothetical protein
MRDRRHRALVPLILLLAIRSKLCDSCGFGQLKHLWVVRCTRLTLSVVAWLSSKLDGFAYITSLIASRRLWNAEHAWG